MGGTGRPTVLGSLAGSRGLGGRGARGRQSCPRGARFRGGAARRPPSVARVHREPRSAGPGHWIMTSKSNTSARPFPRSALLPGKTGAWVTSESHIAPLRLAAPPPGECQWQRVPGSPAPLTRTGRPGRPAALPAASGGAHAWSCLPLPPVSALPCPDGAEPLILKNNNACLAGCVGRRC